MMADSGAAVMATMEDATTVNGSMTLPVNASLIEADRALTNRPPIAIGIGNWQPELGQQAPI